MQSQERLSRLGISMRTFTKRRLSASFALALTLVAGSAWAHHNSAALFDYNNRVTLTGTLTKIDWRNPHIKLIVDAKDGAQAVTWSLEGPPPNFFRTRNVGKSEFAAAIGQTVTAEASRARDSSDSGLLRIITLPDGKVVSLCPQNC